MMRIVQYTVTCRRPCLFAGLNAALAIVFTAGVCPPWVKALLVLFAAAMILGAIRVLFIGPDAPAAKPEDGYQFGLVALNIIILAIGLMQLGAVLEPGIPHCFTIVAAVAFMALLPLYFRLQDARESHGKQMRPE